MILAVVDEASGSSLVIAAASAAARRQRCAWTALHVETPHNSGEESSLRTAELLALAARSGAAVATVPAADEASGIASYVGDTLVTEIVLRAPRRRRRIIAGGDTVERLLAIGLDAPLLLVPADQPAARRTARARQPEHGAAVGYAVALLSVLALAPVVLLLRSLIGEEALSSLFLAPVLFVSARYRLGPAIFAVVLSIATYNLVVLEPVFALDLEAPQNLLLLPVLLAVAVYISALTGQLRARAALSDRSAQENAGLAAFGLELTKASDWETTARLVCEQACALFTVEAILFREVRGELVVAGAFPEDTQLAPLDRTSLDWAWSKGEEAGSGTQVLPDCNWQFQPLQTSLGVLAVLAVARHDGRNPVPAQKRVLFETFLAQAALAHERLRLEDGRASGERRH